MGRNRIGERGRVDEWDRLLDSMFVFDYGKVKSSKIYTFPKVVKYRKSVKDKSFRA